MRQNLVTILGRRKMALYGYARVSTKQQELTGNGLEVQVHDLLEAGVPENNIYKDAATGATLDRPSFEELRLILKSGDTLSSNNT